MRWIHFLSNLGFQTGKVFVPLSSLCVSLLAADPGTADLIRQGDAADGRGDTRAALALFQQAEKLDANNAAVLVRISKQYTDLIGQTKPPAEAEKCAQSSIDYAKRAVELDPKIAKAHLALAVAYGKMTSFTDNKTKLEYSKIIKSETDRSIEIDPTDDYAYYVLGCWNYNIVILNPMLRIMAKVVYGGLPQASMEDAEKALKKATELAPQRILHHHELAIVYRALGKNDLAAKESETILTLHAGDKEDEAAQKEAKELLKKN